MTHGRGSEGETGEWSGQPVPFTLRRNKVYPALLPLMRTPRLPVVDWADAPADLNGLVHFAERRNLVSARVSSHFKRSLIIIIIGIKPVTNQNECHFCSNRIDKRQLAHSSPNFYVYNCLVSYVRGSDGDNCSPIQCVLHSDLKLLYMKHRPQRLHCQIVVFLHLVQVVSVAI